jgi:hypothetical protein
VRRLVRGHDRNSVFQVSSATTQGTLASSASAAGKVSIQGAGLTPKLLCHFGRRHVAGCQHRLGGPDLGLIECSRATTTTTTSSSNHQPGTGAIAPCLWLGSSR